MSGFINTNLEIKAIDETGVFSGYASTHTVDQGGDQVMPGAFTKTLAKHESDGAWPVMLWAHETNKPIGAFTKMAEDVNGLFVEGKLWVDFPAVDSAVTAYRGLKAGNVTGLSIGYLTHNFDYDGEIRQLKELELFEISLLPFPMNNDARVSNVKSGYHVNGMPKAKHLEAVLRDAGLSRAEAKAVLSDGYKDAKVLRDAENSELLAGQVDSLLAAMS